MSNTTYSDFSPPAINAAWLNDVNNLVYNLVGNGVNAPANDTDVLVNLGATGRLLNVQTFTASGTYIPTVGTTSIIVDMVGGGASGSGTVATGVGQLALGIGGGGGAFCRSRFTSGFVGASVVVGAGGAAPAAGAAGNNGGASSFLGMTAGGGAGGSAGTAVPTSNVRGSLAGGVATGGNILNVPGEPSKPAWGALTPPIIYPSLGGGSRLGWGGVAGANPSTAPSSAATGYGGGGSGSGYAASLPASAGGAGTSGIVIIYEYA